MAYELNGRLIKTDDEGYLLDKDEWSEDLMQLIAGHEDLQLTTDHLLVINTVRRYYEEYASTPAIRALITLLKKEGHEDFNSIRLAVLFPKGAAKTAAKLAGLPKPVKCI